ncbi:hypothetical protein BH09GEM1_BH09GEM1_28030 [soil metagenome]
MRTSARLIGFLIVQVLSLAPAARAQDASRDSVFTTGPCRIRSDSVVAWDNIASHVDRQPRVVPATLPMFPMRLRSTDGYSGRIVLSMVVDTLGRVQPASVSVEESTDPRLSSWGCIVALTLRFAPALVAGRPVSALTEQALSYNFSGAPGRP